jgi:hypothetical protein
VSLQIFTVSGHPKIHKPQNQPSKKLTDDFITGETYTSLRIVSGGNLPPVLTANQYLRWALTGDDVIPLKVDKKYAFLVMFDNPAAGQEFALANKYHGTYPDGHGIRREGSIDKPYDHLDKVFNVVFGDERDDRSASSLPLDPTTRFNQQPGTWGRPDVDTYRTLRFYIEGT